jgi:hypothetical protein
MPWPARVVADPRARRLEPAPNMGTSQVTSETAKAGPQLGINGDRHRCWVLDARGAICQRLRLMATDPLISHFVLVALGGPSDAHRHIVI